MTTLDNRNLYFAVFIVVSLSIIGALLWRATLPEPKIDNIVCDEQIFIDQIDNIDFDSVCSDQDDNIYLFLRNFKKGITFVVKMNKEGEQVSWFEFPYISNLHFYVMPAEADMVFYRGRSGETYLYSNTGELIKETTLEDLGLDVDLVTQNPREATLSNGVNVRIYHEKGKYQLVATRLDGSRVTLIKQTD